jgi:cytochrome c553
MFIPLFFALSSANPPAPPVVSPMHEHYRVATQIRDAVIQGQLAVANDAAKALVGLEPPEGLPPLWRPWMAQVKAQADVIATAKDLTTAASAVGALAAACADCHQEMNGGPGLERMHDVPPQSWPEGSNMPLHRWSVDWMWLGLIASDDEAWDRGANALDDHPVAPMFGDLPPSAEPRQLEATLYSLAARALELDDNQRTARGELLGDMLGTCATCHRLRDAGTVTRPAQVNP